MAGVHAPRVVELCSSDGSCWNSGSDEPLIQTAQVGGRTQPLQWKQNSSASTADAHAVRFVYQTTSTNPALQLRLISEWKIRETTHGPGPIEHTIRIENKGREDIQIPLQDSLQITWSVPPGTPLQQLWIEKGAGGPSAEGTHQISINDSYEWTGTSSTYAHPPAGQQREMIPYVLLSSPREQASGFYLGIEFSGRTRIHISRREQLL